MSVRRAGGAVVAAALALVALGPPVRAHGPAPVALEVLALEGERPALLRTNLGLARGNGDGTYAFVCPSRWDDNPLARAAASPDSTEVLVHSAGVAYHSSDAGCTFDTLPADDLYILDAVATDGGFLLLAEDYPDDPDTHRSRLLRVDGGRLTELEVALPGAVDGLIATESGWLAAGHSPIGFAADERGVLATFDTDASRLTPRTRREGEVWLRSTSAGRVSFVRVRGGVAETSDVSVTSAHGPLWLGGRWLAVLDGTLHELEGRTWRRVGDVDWTCLSSLEGRSFACSLEAMRDLAPGSAGAIPAATPAFSMLQIGPPDRCGDAAAREACALSWAHYAGESGWTRTDAATSPTEPRRAPSPGCAVTRGAPSAWWMFALALLSLVRTPSAHRGTGPSPLAAWCRVGRPLALMRRALPLLDGNRHAGLDECTHDTRR